MNILNGICTFVPSLKQSKAPITMDGLHWGNRGRCCTKRSLWCNAANEVRGIRAPGHKRSLQRSRWRSDCCWLITTTRTCFPRHIFLERSSLFMFQNRIIRCVSWWRCFIFSCKKAICRTLQISFGLWPVWRAEMMARPASWKCWQSCAAWPSSGFPTWSRRTVLLTQETVRTVRIVYWCTVCSWCIEHMLRGICALVKDAWSFVSCFSNQAWPFVTFFFIFWYCRSFC